MVMWGMYQVVNYQTRPAPGGTVNSGCHESKTGNNVVKVEAIDIRKVTSDHKCISIRNPSYKYKHYKFLKI